MLKPVFVPKDKRATIAQREVKRAIIRRKWFN
jgi:hypothetical protein